MAPACVDRFRSVSAKATDRSGRATSRRPRLRGVEALEGRELLSTFTVTNLHGSGAGSLRQAIVASNERPGADAIDFSVAGTIRLGRKALPAIRDTVTIDGSSAPSFAGTPVVTVNFRGTRGLRFAEGSAGSTLRSLALVRAGNSGVTLDAPNITVQGSYIGVLADGKTVAGNRGDGIRINAPSHGDLIGQTDPVKSITYYNTDSVSMPVTGWQGLREAGTPGQYLITGTSGTNGLLYVGPISGAGGTSYAVNYPGATSTSLYGPDIVSPGVLRLVGSYKTGDGRVQGFLFQGTSADLANQTNYRTINYPGAKITYVHSTSGDLAVGNGGDILARTDHAFVYSVSQDHMLANVVYPGATTTSAYGIWYNGATSYTICGGYTTLNGPDQPLSQGYLVDYDAATGQFSHWTSFAGPDGLVGPSLVTHFEGISGPSPGVYTLSAGTSDPTSSTPFQAAWTVVRRNADGTFGPASWVNLNYPSSAGLGTADSVAGNQVVGLAQLGSDIIAYQATVNLGGGPSNVISGNLGRGIGIYGASGNRILTNHIGTDVTGTLRRGNAKGTIVLARGASQNVIDGQQRDAH